MMNLRKFVLLSAVAVAGFGQAVADKKELEKPTAKVRVPSLVWERISLVGERLLKAGKEQAVYAGTLEDLSGGSSRTLSVTISHQFPDLVRVEEGGRRLVSFNGESASKAEAQLSPLEAALLDAFLSDSMEGILEQSTRGALVEEIGRNYRVSDSRGANRLTGFCDLLRVSSASKFRGRSVQEERTYCFDSLSGYLKSVAYSSKGSRVETRLEDWVRRGSDAFPGKIVRVENGRVLFRLTLSSQSATGKGQASEFSN